MSLKTERIASNLVKEISYILATKIKDRDIRFVTVTDCKVTTDLSFAKVYVTVLDDTKKEETLKALKNASGYIRREIGQRINLRYNPQIIFELDDSINYGMHIEELIQKVKDK